MGRSTKKEQIITPDELELINRLTKAMTTKAAAEQALDSSRREISRLTGEINKLGFVRARVVWTEAFRKVRA